LSSLIRSMVQDRIDIVHTPDFFPAFLGRVASLFAGVPHRVHTLHSVYEWYPDFVFPIQKLLGRSTEIITGVSRAAIEFSRTKEGLPEEKYRLVPNGADGDRFRPDPERSLEFRREQGWSSDDLVVGTVGARTPRKMHPLLARSLAPLMRQNPRIRLAILGNKGRSVDTRSEVEAALGEDLRDRLHFLDPRPDVERVFSAFDIHCMPSEVEGLSFASIEGLLSGCISVFSDLPAFQEVSEGGETAILFRQGDESDLRRALETALDRVSSKVKWGVQSRERTLEKFGQDRMVSTYAAIYAELVQKRLQKSKG